MGLIENLGRVASSYMEEKEQLQIAGEKRVRTRTGHGFWPQEVLRDSIHLFAFMGAVLAVLRLADPTATARCCRPVRSSRIRVP